MQILEGVFVKKKINEQKSTKPEPEHIKKKEQVKGTS